jgi:acetylornithine deacetylase/succinyl-diaminopimelate desuccinylase-like protein
MAGREQFVKYVDEHFDQGAHSFVERLKTLVRIPSVSDWPQNKHEVLRCAKAVRDEVEKVGLHNAQLLNLNNLPEGKFVAPCVFGEWLKAEGQPTVLLYAHYDVQPPGKDNLWKESLPFEPKEQDKPDIGGKRLYGRGTADDKAGIIAHLGAVESILKTFGSLPINVKVLFEGEEEVGSTHLEQFLEQHFSLLKSDVLILADTGNYDIGVPSITYSLRGIVGLDVELRTVQASVHSGMWGGPVIDPLAALCKLIGTLHDDTGKVAVEGFNDGVRNPSDKEAANLKQLNYTEAKLRKESGLLSGVKVAGDPNTPVLEKVWLKPAINIIALDACELKNAANKILNSAIGRISVRIVADQDPKHILEVLKAHLTKHVPYGAQIFFSNEVELKPWVCVPEGDVFTAAERALKLGYNHDPVLVGCGGSIGFVEPFAKAFGGAPALLIGVEDPYTNAHGENESLLLGDFKKSILSLAHLLFELKK